MYIRCTKHNRQQIICIYTTQYSFLLFVIQRKAPVSRGFLSDNICFTYGAHCAGGGFGEVSIVQISIPSKSTVTDGEPPGAEKTQLAVWKAL